MGVYEIITGITKNEENLKVEIRQTEGTLERNLVYIKNTKTNRAYSFTLADGDEYGADAMTRNAVAKLHSDMCGCNEKTLDRIEHALGIKLETWQSELSCQKASHIHMKEEEQEKRLHIKSRHF